MRMLVAHVPYTSPVEITPAPSWRSLLYPSEVAGRKGLDSFSTFRSNRVSLAYWQQRWRNVQRLAVEVVCAPPFT